MENLEEFDIFLIEGHLNNPLVVLFVISGQTMVGRRIFRIIYVLKMSQEGFQIVYWDSCFTNVAYGLIVDKK